MKRSIASWAVIWIVVGAANAQMHRIPTEKLADASERGAVGLVSPQKEGGTLSWAAAEGPVFLQESFSPPKLRGRPV